MILFKPFTSSFCLGQLDRCVIGVSSTGLNMSTTCFWSNAVSCLPVPATGCTLHLQGSAAAFDKHVLQSEAACRRQYSNSALHLLGSAPSICAQLSDTQTQQASRDKAALDPLINMFAGYRCTQPTQDTELVVSACNSARANTAAARQSVRHRSAKLMNAHQC